MAAAIANGRYLTWTLTLASEKVLNLDSISITGYSQDQVVNFALFTDLTGSFQEGDAIASWEVPNTIDAPTGRTEMINLSAIPELQEITSPIEFRLYYWGKTKNAAQIGIGRAFKSWGEPGNDLEILGTIIDRP